MNITTISRGVAQPGSAIKICWRMCDGCPDL